MIKSSIQDVIEGEFNAEITSVHPVHGGDINDAYRVTLQNSSVYFIKVNDRFDNMFEVEAKGLQILREASHSLIIPVVKFHNHELLILEFLEEHKSPSFEDSYNLGIGLAELHANTSTSFGLDHSNYIGSLHQQNNHHSSWADFYISERIEPQLRLVQKKGNLESISPAHLQKLHNCVDAICPKEPPALLHGDLWSGNYFFTQQGPAIFDPAIYYGNREVDLAMTKLFGGFDSNFHEGYTSKAPIQPNFSDRINLYNLYPILVHANIFGGHYVERAKQIIFEYVR